MEDDAEAKPKTTVYESLKKTSSVLDRTESRNPKEGIDIGKIKGATGNSRLRELIAGLNSEKDQ
jgi:hypothetical protein